MQEDPAILGDPLRPCQLNTGDDHRRSLVDLVARHDEAGIGISDEAVSLRDRHQLLRRPFHRCGCEGVLRRDLRERSEQRADHGCVVRAPHPEPSAPRILEQRVLGGRIDQAVLDLRAAGEALESVAAILQAAADFLGEIGGVFTSGERPRGRDRLGSEDERCAGLPCGDRLREFGDQVLRALAACDLQDRPARVHADSGRDRAGVVVGAAQRRFGTRGGDLELPHAGDGVDDRRVDAGVLECRPGRLGGEADRGEPPVVRRVEGVAHLAHTDDDRSARVEFIVHGHAPDGCAAKDRGCGHVPQRPCHRGCRFSANARMPSRESSLVIS